MTRIATLPMHGTLTLASRLTSGIACLVTLASAVGLTLGARGWYDADPATLPAFLGQDAVSVVVGLPLLLGSAWSARRGSTRGLLCWAGALFYIAYSYFFYVIGARFSALLPVYIALVSLGMYGALALVFALDIERLKARFDEATPVRAVGGYLIATSLFFAALWLLMIAASLRAEVPVTMVQRAVIAVDGVVLLPLLCFGGLALWRRAPLGYALAGLLLVKAAATFLTLLVSTGFVVVSGQSVSPGETVAYTVGLILASLLAVIYFRHVRDHDAAGDDAVIWRVSLWQEEL